MFSSIETHIMSALARGVALEEERRLGPAELQESEQRYRTLVSNIPGVVYRCACDEHRTMELISDSIQDISGYPASDFIDSNVRSYTSIVHPDDTKLVEEIILDGVSRKEPYIVEHRILHADGNIRWVCERGQGIFAKNGDLMFLDGVIFDISAQRQEVEALPEAHRDLELRTVELERANKELSQYAHAISHDIMAPLRAIHNYADFLREDLEATLDGDQKMYLEGLGRAVRQGERLVEDVLEFSRIGGRSMSIETIDMGAFFRELIKSLDLSPDVEVVMRDDWPSIDTEPLFLRQIFQNLIDNAIKFNRSKSRRVEIGWHPVGKESYKLFVRDNGIGIEPRYQEQIFHVFQRLHSNEEYDGTGIGLATVSEAINRLQGSVSVESEPGKGSTFFVTLPGAQKER